LKYTPSGILQWVTRYSGLLTNGGDYGNGMIIDSNKIYVTGMSRKTINSDHDEVTIKYDQILGINSTENGIPRSYKLFQNYPNPFNNSTMITYTLPEESFIELEIYSITGENIAALVKTKQEAGIYSIMINMEGYSSGVYFYTLKAGNKYFNAKKLVYIK
jgi:hypothetical protein